MNKSIPKGIIFDMDGVIVDNLRYHFDALKQWLGKYGHELTNDEFKQKINGRTIQEIVLSYINPKLNQDQIMQYAQQKEALYRQLYTPYLTATKGLVPFLETCKQQKIALAVATSALPENVEFTLDGLGIRHFFQHIIDSTQVSKGKPDPEIYIKAQSKLVIEKAECLVLEDALAGIQAGNGAGMRVAGITTTHTVDELMEVGAAFCFTDFHHLSEILAF